ncbi:hypothetical protein ACH5RR_008873 [Cinchona calisaya]|uniref:Uncharacterized protein n=1 Tax=Cinchona calisaya TaxID=153742 RepID=A0ABD3ACQ1_9GENT
MCLSRLAMGILQSFKKSTGLQERSQVDIRKLSRPPPERGIYLGYGGKDFGSERSVKTDPFNGWSNFVLEGDVLQVIKDLNDDEQDLVGSWKLAG